MMIVWLPLQLASLLQAKTTLSSSSFTSKKSSLPTSHIVLSMFTQVQTDEALVGNCVFIDGLMENTFHVLTDIGLDRHQVEAIRVSVQDE